VLDRVDPHEAYFSPVWSADSHSLYTAHFTPSDSGSSSPFKYTLERLTVPDGKPEVLLQDALWPNVSPDGKQLAYVVSDPKNNANYLYVADQDGANARVIVTPDQFLAVDAPFFAPDSSYVIFSAVGEGPAGTPTPALSWLDPFLGVQTAAAAAPAHNVPSDWWRINTDGTGLARLTKQYDTSMFGTFAPDGQHIAFLSASGLYVMNPDGSAVKRLLKTTGYGTIDWVK
jgi:Tol biopolymer transport system component